MRQVGDPQGATRVARGPGKILREAREAAGFSLEEMARRTRLQPRVIEAVEADAYEHLAGTGFVKGYIRLMAREVELDPAVPLAEFDLQFSAIEPAIADFESSPPAELTSANRWIKATSVGLLVLLLGLIVAWWERHQRDATAPEGEAAAADANQQKPDPGTPLPYAFTIVEHSTNPFEAPANWRRQSDGSAPPAETSLPTDARADAAPAETSPRPDKPAAVKPAVTEKPTPDAAPVKASDPAKPPAEGGGEKPATKPASSDGAAGRPARDEAPSGSTPERVSAKDTDAPQAATAQSAPAVAPVPAGDRPDLVLHAARNDSWVEITDRVGEKLWAGTVKRGGRIGVTGKPPYSVVIGNALDVDVTWRQRPVKLGRTIQNGTARGTIGEPD